MLNGDGAVHRKGSYPAGSDLEWMEVAVRDCKRLRTAKKREGPPELASMRQTGPQQAGPRQRKFELYNTPKQE